MSAGKPLHFIMHIPKTAGMSLQALVRRRYKKPESLHLVYEQEQVENGFEDEPELKLVMGHYRFGYHQFTNRPYAYYTFLRNPLEQLVSHYHYTKDHPEKFRYLDKGIDNLMDFARCPYGYNLQTRFISGIDDLSSNPKKALYQAKVNLVKHFEVIGLTEEFDLSLLMLAKKLKWKIAYYTNENKGKARKKHPPLTDEESHQLKEILKYDIELYDFARKLFKSQLDKNPGLTTRLPFYRIANRAFQALNPTYISIKQLLGNP